MHAYSSLPGSFFQIATFGRVYYVCALSDEVREEWVTALAEAAAKVKGVCANMCKCGSMLSVFGVYTLCAHMCGGASVVCGRCEMPALQDRAIAFA